MRHRCSTVHLGLLILLLFIANSAYAQEKKVVTMEFQDRPIADILLALASFSGTSIIPDETVKGNASYYFSDMDIGTALEVFCRTYNLFYKVENGIYYVSKINTSLNTFRNTINIDTEEVDVQHVLRSVSKTLGKTILYDAMPPEKITIHAQDISPESLLGLIVSKLKTFELETKEDYFYIKKKELPRDTLTRTPGEPNVINIQGNLLSIHQTKRSFFDILDELFKKAGLEYSLMTNKNVVIDQIHFENRTFEQLLGLLLEQADSDFQVKNGVYYIFEIDQKSILNRLRSTAIVPLIYITPQEVQKLFPPDILASRIAKVDITNNAVILFGSSAEIDPVLTFIKKIDRPLDYNAYYRFDLNFIKAEKIREILPAALKSQELILIPESNSFTMLLSEPNKEKLEEYLSLIDLDTETAEIRLRYIKAEDLIQHLPPSVIEGDIIETGSPSVVFFKGSKEKLGVFLEELAVLDQPVPQITYQLLIIQFSEGTSLNWQDQVDSLVEVSYPKDARNAYTGKFGHLLGLGFDVFTALGTKIALQLNLSLSTNEASVLTDTKLSGLSGETIEFRDTDTYRYTELEALGGEEKASGVIREVSTGLIVTIQGWVSGDGMITMVVDATVSKQGVDTASTAGSLPPTTEKKVSTQIRTFAGKPVILSGLYRWDTTSSIDKTPILGDIPILGWLFKKKIEKKIKSEVVIYIMPHIEEPEKSIDTEKRLQRIYRNLFLPTFAGIQGYDSNHSVESEKER